MGDIMQFPATFDEFAEQYKIVDKKEIYTNGTELIPIFRVKQWLDNAAATRGAGEWKKSNEFEERYGYLYQCSVCKTLCFVGKYCPECGAKMKGGDDK